MCWVQVYRKLWPSRLIFIKINHGRILGLSGQRQVNLNVVGLDTLYTLVTIMTDVTDGGYYALKGFLYQFDCALIEMIRNPNIDVAFENRQDIDYDDYVLQIKHKETQSYKPIKIRKAVTQLLELFAASNSLKLVLYCHFNDRTKSDWRLSLAELDKIIGTKAQIHSVETRRAFLKAFTIRFSEDYETQFNALLSLIKTEFSIKTDEEAIIYHSLFRSHLLAKSILRKEQRRCSSNDLTSLRTGSEQIVFYAAYSRYLGDAKYEAMLRKRFFTFTAPNIENFERLFILQPETTASREAVTECVTRLSRKYFRRSKSPQPYVCIRDVSKTFINDVKQALLDQGMTLFDGTHFDGDRFRPDELIRKRVNDPEPRVKFIPESMLSDILTRSIFTEVFQVYVYAPLKINSKGRYVCIAVTDLAQAARILK